MKKKLLFFILAFALFFSISNNNAVNAESNFDSIKEEVPYMDEGLIYENIKSMSEKSGKSEEEVISQILKELDQAKGGDNYFNLESINNTSKKYGSKQFQLTNANYPGDIFYEPAKTVIPHGHVGIYYTKNIIVESDSDRGVIKKPTYKKFVAKGSKVFNVTNVSRRSAELAGKWSYSRLGDSYSKNFFNNRNSGCYGDKNCSKLVWCAYKIKANIDLDSNGGFGVYPNDILNYRYIRIYKRY